MHQSTTVSAQFESCTADLKFIEVSNLSTPLGTYKHSLLRSSDIICVEFCLKTDLLCDSLMEELSKNCLLISK